MSGAPIRRRRHARGVLSMLPLLVATFAIVAVACDSPGSILGPTSAPGSTLPSDPVDGTAEPGGTLGPPPAPTPTPPDDASPISLDPALLDYLPPTIAGIPVAEDLDVASEALLDPALPEIAVGVDAAVAVDAGNGNLVTAWVVALRPGAFGDLAYQQWRESYDEGACSATDGIVGTAQADIGGRETYITTCAAALRTYHVWLRDPGIVVSASSIGAGRFGELLMAGLRVPS